MNTNDNTQQTPETLEEQFACIKECVINYIEANPVKAAGIALVTGIILADIL